MLCGDWGWRKNRFFLFLNNTFSRAALSALRAKKPLIRSETENRESGPKSTEKNQKNREFRDRDRDRNFYCLLHFLK